MALIILSDKINSGKSETIVKLSKIKNIFCGFVQLKVKEQRFIKYLETNEIDRLSNFNINENYKIKVGNFVFDNRIFNKLNSLIINSVSLPTNKFFVIDEWGLLEQESRGLFKGIDFIIKNNFYIKNNYLIIIREWLLDNFLLKYSHIKKLVKLYNISNINLMLNNY